MAAAAAASTPPPNRPDVIQSAALSGSAPVHPTHTHEVSITGILTITITSTNADGSPKKLERHLKVSVGGRQITNQAVVKKMFEKSMLIQQMSRSFLEKSASTKTHSVQTSPASSTSPASPTKLRFTLTEQGHFSVQNLADSTETASSPVIPSSGLMKGAAVEAGQVARIVGETARIARTHHECRKQLDEIFENIPARNVVADLEKIIGENSRSMPIKKLAQKLTPEMQKKHLQKMDPTITTLSQLLARPGNEGLRFALSDKLEAAHKDAKTTSRLSGVFGKEIEKTKRSELLTFIVANAQIPIVHEPAAQKKETSAGQLSIELEEEVLTTNAESSHTQQDLRTLLPIQAVKEVIQEEADKQWLADLKGDVERQGTPVKEILLKSQNPRLFPYIHADIQANSTEPGRTKLLEFCIDWVKANRDTAEPSEYEKVKGIIAQIIANVKGNEPYTSPVQKLGLVLEEETQKQTMLQRLDSLLHLDPAVRKAKIAAFKPAGRAEIKCWFEKADKPMDVKQMKPVKDTVDEVIKEKADEKLLTALKNNAQVKGVNLSELLVLSNTDIIPTERLFRCIREDLKTKGQQNEKEILLQFCIDWVTANRNSTEYDEASPFIGEIIDYAISNGMLSLGQQLGKAKGQNFVYLEPMIIPEAKATSFEEVLENVKNNKTKFPGDKSYTQTVAQVADDLLTLQKAFYKQMTPHDLMQDKVPVGTNTAVKASEKFSEKFHDYFVAQIRAEKNSKKQERLIKFLIDVTQACKEKGDIQSAKTMYEALSTTQCNADRIVNAQYQKMKGGHYGILAVAHGKLFHYNDALRAETPKATVTVPSQVPYLYALEHAPAREDILIRDEEYNTQMLLDKRNLAQEYLKLPSSSPPSPRVAVTPKLETPKLGTTLCSLISDFGKPKGS